MCIRDSSLPKLMGAGDVALEAAAYGAGDYAALFAVIASTVLLLTGMIAVLSAFAKTVKEASMLVMPLMIVSMLVGVTSMFGDVHAQLGWYCIPLYNSVPVSYTHLRAGSGTTSDPAPSPDRS